ncbi:alpha-2-HS-glycoprotein 1 [Labrus bergylta]|uniref:Fetuin-B-like n=1 Tax=Labrus bergylta TaxID=56723 RepID=A0A3Q3G6Q6_9LABR|nr:fetuin-B-like [Labrus bergylta]
MKGFSTLVLLFSAVLLCHSAPALEPVTCTSENVNAAARLAMHHIDMHHSHGYKFRLLDIKGNKMEETDTGCNIELKLGLGETQCHVVNPKHFEDCEYSGASDGSVMSSCTVMMTVVESDAQVTSYSCETQREISKEELSLTCPDCPVIMALNDKEGLNAALEAVKEFNKNTTNQNYFVLQDVGRLKLGYIMSQGMRHFSEIALVESNCPLFSRIVPAACKALCSHRAQHAVCRSSYSKTSKLVSLRCEYYPALDSSPLPPGEMEPICEQPPSFSPAGPPAPPPNAGAAQIQIPLNPLPPVLPCHASPQQEFHPICNWP